MVMDLLKIARLLEEELPAVSQIMAYLKPRFTLVGSAAEGTRIGLGSEIDLTMRFEGWMKQDEAPFEMILRNSDHLYKGGQTPKWAEWYFEKDTIHYRFMLDRFKCDLLSSFDSALCKIFQAGKNPSRLKIQPNVHVHHDNPSKPPFRGCEECHKRISDRTNVQCESCMFATSQTKLGICLQFTWISETGQEAYCSMDVIPTYRLVILSGKVYLKLLKIESTL